KRLITTIERDLALPTPPLRKRELANASSRLEEVMHRWQKAKGEVEERNRPASEKWSNTYKAWSQARAEWIKERDTRNTAIDTLREGYLAGDPRSVAEYCRLVVARSVYPECFPCESIIDYIEDTKTVITDYALPVPAALPTLKEVKYVNARGDFQEVRVSDAWINRTYESVLYQIALRCIYELFQADLADALSSIAFNGWVEDIDKTNGQIVNACVLSVQANKSEFMALNLAQVDPKLCFKKLKGVSAAKLTALQPVRPVLQLK